MGKIKEILCIHHSHLDIGYTHPQALLMELQRDYIDDAIELCLKTADYPEASRFRWTCEATLPVLKWLETASVERIELFKELIKKKQISICALSMHTTPQNDTKQIFEILESKKQLEKQLDMSITCAINHDVNGQPWPFGQILRDAGVEFYLTGINVHFGGIPFKRPSVFNWQAPDGGNLLTYLGEHYSLFSQFFFTCENDTKRMYEGILDYTTRIESEGYDEDFIVLTATNPPLFDNNCPDFDLADLIKKYNEEGHEFTIRFITPEDLHERVKQIEPAKIPIYSGDWTDYWNFGSGSTVQETKLTKRTRQVINKAQFLEVFNGSLGKHYDVALEEAKHQSNLFNEHTWGAAASITDPDDVETYSQAITKKNMAHKAASLAAYALGHQAEEIVKNSKQSTEPEGIVLVNTSSKVQVYPLNIPDSYFLKERHLSALRIKQYLPYHQEDTTYYGTIKLDPLSIKKLALSDLKQPEKSSDFELSAGKIETPYYIFEYQPKTGKILRLFDKVQNWEAIDSENEYAFFDFVEETIDERHDTAHRSTFFPRDLDLGNKSISVWNHNWTPLRKRANELLSLNVEIVGDKCIFRTEYLTPNQERLEKEVIFYDYQSAIGLEAVLYKKAVRKPESNYFSFPLNLSSGWRCTYDTAETFVKLDEEQLGNVSRDWITIDKTVSLYDDTHGMSLATLDAQLVQVGDFNFGKESRNIKRSEKPLLLSWIANNYWDTNFSTEQPGKLTFSYLLQPFGKFKVEKVMELVETVSEPVVMNACIDLNNSGLNDQLFELNSQTTQLLFIKPSAAENGMLMILRNHGDIPEDVKVNFPNRKILSAAIVNPLEEKVESIAAKTHGLKVNVQKGQLMCLQLIFTDDHQ